MNGKLRNGFLKSLIKNMVRLHWIPRQQKKIKNVINGFGINEDGLKQSWTGEKVFCNPPYSNCYEFLKKAYDEFQTNNKTESVFLLPSRTGTKWFKEFAMKANKIIFIRGRLKFGRWKQKLCSI